MYRLSLFGPFSLTDSTGTDVPVTSKKARALLAYLAQSPGAQRSREEIIALLWSDRGEEQGRTSLRQVLAGLRKQAGPELLRVTRESITLNTDLVLITPSDDAEFLSGLHISDPAFDDWLRDERLRLEADAPFDPAKGPPDRSSKPTIVVLPLANLSDEGKDTYFAAGLTEDLATELNRFGFINVVARNTVFDMTGEGDAQGRTLSDINTDYAVDGSFRKTPDRICLNVKLIDCATGQHIWSDRFDRDVEDTFALQDDLVEALVLILSERVDWHRSKVARRKPASSLEAYDHYMQGVWHSYRYDYQSQLAARSALEKAIELDPTFALAISELAIASMMISWHEGNFDERSEDILALAQRALALDPTAASILGDLGAIQLADWQHDAARDNFETAMRLNPHDSDIWAQYAWLLSVTSQPELALQYLDRTIEADPYPPDWVWGTRVVPLYDLGRYAEVVEILERIPKAYPKMLGQLAACYGHLCAGAVKGDHGEGRRTGWPGRSS